MPESHLAARPNASDAPADRGVVLVAIARDAIGERLALARLRRRDEA